MIRPTILIMSHREDEHLPVVLRQLEVNAEPLVVDRRHFAAGLVGSIRPGEDPSVVLRLPNGEVAWLDEVSAVWWRRPTSFQPREDTDRIHRDFVTTEQNQFFEGLLACLPERTRFYNHPDAHRRLDRKVYQLNLAAACGLSTPATCVASDPESAALFLSQYRKAIYKSFWGTPDFWQPTRMVDEKVLSSIMLAVNCPVIFQEYVEGNWDYRITVIDGELFGVRFDLRQSRYACDVRIDTRIPCEVCEVPEEIGAKLREFCRRASLRYAAIDMRQRTDGQFTFFEVNPAGQFMYLDILAGTDIARAMGRALSRGEEAVDRSGERGKTALNDAQYELPKSPAPLHSVGDRVTHLT